MPARTGKHTDPPCPPAPHLPDEEEIGAQLAEETLIVEDVAEATVTPASAGADE